MGKSIRSKIKRKWRARRHEVANKPFSDKLQRESDWRLQQAQLGKLSATAGKSLQGIAQALRSGTAPMQEEGEEVAKGAGKDATVKVAVGSSAALLDAPKNTTRGSDRLNIHAVGPHTRSKKTRHGIPHADPTLAQAQLSEHRKIKKRPFAFIERTWEIEKPPEDADILHSSDLVPEGLKGTGVPVDDGTANEVMNVDLKAELNGNVQRDPARRRAIGKNKKRSVQMKRRKRIKKCNPN